MNKIKIYLSRECVNRLTESMEYGSSNSHDEHEKLYRIMGDLGWANDNRDKNGRLEITRETLDWVLSELDWYCTAYCNEAEKK